MSGFENFQLNKHLQSALDDLGFVQPTPIQVESFPVILSGKDMVGIAQTGTGKTLAYLLPLIQELKFSNQIPPRVVILVPTRELVLQIVENIQSITLYMNIRVLGVYGGTNINTQAIAVREGVDIIVATPGRLYDLTLNGALQLKEVRKLVIDEVDVMLDLGFRFQLTNILDLLPSRRQNTMFSATMTEEVDTLIDEYFIKPTRISIAVSGTRLENIDQVCYKAPNFYSKANLLAHLLQDASVFKKVLVFVSNKKGADRLFEVLEDLFTSEVCIIHSNKSQNYRIRSINQFNEGVNRILVATDVMARGLDLEEISHVVNFDTPIYPENYMHRIGRTGRAEKKGSSVLFYTEAEEEFKEKIEKLMDYKIPQQPWPSEVEVSKKLTPDEQPKNIEINAGGRAPKLNAEKAGFHEKKDKNKKTNQGGSYKMKIAKKYKKPITRGDKNMNRKKK